MTEADARVPVTVVTGALGVGKTTALRELFRCRPREQSWAVLVNEFGEVGIDQALLVDSGVMVRELPGGCLCCTLGVPFQVRLTELVARARPQRLFIEPTGLGHPVRMIERLMDGPLAQAVRLDAVVCLVDPRRLDDTDFLASDVYRDQIAMADVLVAAKADLAGEAALSRFRDWSEGLFPRKVRVALSTGARPSPFRLRGGDAPPAARRGMPSGVPAAHGASVGHRSNAAHAQSAETTPGGVLRLPNAGERDGCGWLFRRDFVFRHDPLLAMLEALPEVDRLKGVFRTERGWIAVQGGDGNPRSEETAWRHDSRLELIARPGCRPAWEAFESALRGVIMQQRTSA